MKRLSFLIFLFIFQTFAVNEIGECADILSPGKYIVKNNITDSDFGYCIRILTNNVTLDCQGFAIKGVGFTSSKNYYGIGIFGNNVTVKNCEVYLFDKGITTGPYKTKIRIENCSIHNVSYNGIYIEAYTNALVRDFHCYHIYNNTYVRWPGCIYVKWPSGNVNITHGRIENSTEGICVDCSSPSNCLVSDVHIKNVEDHAISLWGLGSSNNLFVENCTVNTAKYCVGIWNVRSTTIKNSRFENCSYGIYIRWTAGHHIYNNFFNNTANFFAFGRNYLNTSKMPGINIVGGQYIGGNFWATPNGDGFSEMCNDTDGDGICDSPYRINSANIDYLPLAAKEKRKITLILKNPHPSPIKIWAFYINRKKYPANVLLRPLERKAITFSAELPKCSGKGRIKVYLGFDYEIDGLNATFVGALPLYIRCK